MPSSSETTPRSLIEAMISFAALSSPRRFSAIAASAWDSSPKSVHSFLTCLTNSSESFALLSLGTPLKECR